MDRGMAHAGLVRHLVRRREWTTAVRGKSEQLAVARLPRLVRLCEAA